MQKDNIISFARLESSRKVRSFKNARAKSAALKGGASDASKRDKIVSLRPRNVHFPFAHVVRNVDIPNGPYYL